MVPQRVFQAHAGVRAPNARINGNRADAGCAESHSVAGDVRHRSAQAASVLRSSPMRHLIAVTALVLAAPLQAQLRVVTSTTDLADIAREVGGSKVRVTHVSEGYQDPHFAEAKPSFVLQLRKADVFAFVGLDLEIGWMPLLIQGARNPKVSPGGSGYLDVSTAIEVLDRATARVDRSMGDVHAAGNPHYWLDPENGRKIARLFERKFSALDPKNSDAYTANRNAFEDRLNAAEKSWR